MVLGKRWLSGPTAGLREIKSNSKPLLLTIRLIRSLKPDSDRPVRSTQTASLCSLLSWMSSTIFSFHHPFHALGSSLIIPSPVAARIRESCHQPPFTKASGFASVPIVGPFQILGFGSGVLKTAPRSALAVVRAHNGSLAWRAYACYQNRRHGLP